MTATPFVLVPIIAVVIMVLVFVGICFVLLRLFFSFASRSRGQPLRRTDDESSIHGAAMAGGMLPGPNAGHVPLIIDPADDPHHSRHHHHLDASTTDCEPGGVSHSTDSGSADCGGSSPDSLSGSCDCGSSSSSSSGGDGN
jgi:hypothetical protein